MRKLFIWILYPFCTEFRWFRKRIGGNWYKVQDGCGESGVQSSYIGWVQTVKGSMEIIKSELYEPLETDESMPV